MDYRIWAVLSAVFAGATAVLAKKGVQDIPANTALAIRVAFVFVFSVALAFITKQTDLASLSKKNYLFLGLSGVGTFLSWLCYFRALQGGEVAKVAPIDKLSFVVAIAFGVMFLGERPDAKVLIGAGLIVTGVILTLV